jgi:hypothetical protein
MKKLHIVTGTTFILGLFGLLFFTFGQLTRYWYGVGLYQNESLLLLAWIMLMFGTAFYYSILNAVLYPQDMKKKWEKSARDEF